MRGRPGEALFNLSLLALAGLVIAGSFKVGVGTLAQPGPGLFPLMAGAAIVVPQLVVLFEFFFRKSTQPEGRDNAASAGTLLALVGIFAGWILIMPLLGYILVTFVAVIAFAKTLGLEGWTKPFALAAGTSLGVYLLFDRLLFLDLPRGPLG